MKKPSKFLAVLLAAMTFIPSVGIVPANAVAKPEGNPESNTGGAPGNNPERDDLMRAWDAITAMAMHNPAAREEFARDARDLNVEMMRAGIIRPETVREIAFIEGLRLAYGTHRRHHYVDNFFLEHGRTVHVTRRMLEESRDRNIELLDAGTNNLQNPAIPVDVRHPRNETQNQLRALVLFLYLYTGRRMHGIGDLIISDNDLIEILSVTDFDQQEIDEFDINRIEVRYMNGLIRVIGYDGPRRVFEATLGERYER